MHVDKLLRPDGLNPFAKDSHPGSSIKLPGAPAFGSQGFTSGVQYPDELVSLHDAPSALSTHRLTSITFEHDGNWRMQVTATCASPSL